MRDKKAGGLKGSSEKLRSPAAPLSAARRPARPEVEIENILALFRFDDAHFFGYRLVIAAKLYDRCVAHVVEAAGLSIAQWRVLVQLHARPGGTIRSLAEGVSVDRGESSRAVRDLMEIGAVERIDNPKDARSPTFNLSPAGEALYADILPHMESIIGDLLGEASKDKIEEGAQLLLTVAEGAMGWLRRR